MKARRFNNVMPYVNELWAAQVLGMQVNSHHGPDIIDDKKNCEVKFSFLDRKGKYPVSWTVLEYQMDYNNGKPCYWALGTYRLRLPVKKIKTENTEELERLVTQRELFVVTWDWMHQYPAHAVSGFTRKSGHWHNIFRYPKFKDLPKTTHAYEVDKGLVHLTEGVSEEDFNIEVVPF